MKNNKAVFSTLGASQHSIHEREINDFYATDPIAVKLLLGLEDFNQYIWEPACGKGHISEVLNDYCFTVKNTDLIYRGYRGTEELDFLNTDLPFWKGDIISNPPYKNAQAFIEKALSIIPDGNKVAMFLKVTWLEGKGRKQFFKNSPPRRIWVSSSRLNCAINGEFTSLRQSGGSAIAFAWYIWEKGYKGDPVIKWFN